MITCCNEIKNRFSLPTLYFLLYNSLPRVKFRKYKFLVTRTAVFDLQSTEWSKKLIFIQTVQQFTKQTMRSQSHLQSQRKRAVLFYFQYLFFPHPLCSSPCANGTSIIKLPIDFRHYLDVKKDKWPLNSPEVSFNRSSKILNMGKPRRNFSVRNCFWIQVIEVKREGRKFENISIT